MNEDNPVTQASIAIITCRRPQWLKRLLLALLEQQVTASLALDIIVVDNAVDSDTQQLVSELSKQSKYPLKYHTEPVPGIVAARNKCSEIFLSSDSDYLLFIDDDEWPQDPDWAQKLVNYAIDQTISIVTSHVISVGENGTPAWAVDLIYARNPYQHGQAVDIFYTNNLLLHRSVLTRLAPPSDSRFAMTGASDYHFALRCQLSGISAHYIDAPVIEEFPKSRASIKWFTRRGFRSGIGYTRSHLFEQGFSKTLLRCIPMTLIRLVRGLGLLMLGGVSLNKRRLVDGLFRLCSAAGTIAGFLGIKHDEYKTTHGK